MDNDIYIPINCGLHSEYELAIMHKTRVTIKWESPENSEHSDTVIPVDLIIKNNQEFLKTINSDNVINEIRLDKILQFTRPRKKLK